MCLPDYAYQTFQTIAGRKVFIPTIVAALPGLSMDGIMAGRDAAYAREAVEARIARRKAAHFASHGDSYKALRAQDRYFSNDTRVKRTRGGAISSFGWLVGYENLSMAEAA